MFLTDKRTNLIVEAEMYGLPADTVRRQYTRKRGPAPHPLWDEDYFVFKRVGLVFCCWFFVTELSFTSGTCSLTDPVA